MAEIPYDHIKRSGTKTCHNTFFSGNRFFLTHNTANISPGRWREWRYLNLNAKFSFRKMNLKMSSTKCGPFSSGLNALLRSLKRLKVVGWAKVIFCVCCFVFTAMAADAFVPCVAKRISLSRNYTKCQYILWPSTKTAHKTLINKEWTTPYVIEWRTVYALTKGLLWC